MKKISDCISPFDWIFIYLAAMYTITVLIQPSFYDFCLILIIDIIAFIAFARPTQKIFFKIHPKYKDIFDINYEIKVADNLSESQIREFTQLLISFPKDRLSILFFGSWIKCIPTVIFIVFFVESPRQPLEIFIILLFSFSTNFLFFTSISYFETHRFLTKKLQALIAKNSWNEALLSLDVRFAKNEVLVIERIAQVVLFFLGIGLQAFLILSLHVGANSIGAWQIIGANVISYTLFFRFRYVSDRFLLQGFFNIFDQIDKISDMNPDFYLPVQTAGLLAKFDLSFNRLLNKLRIADKETTFWMLAEAEKSRFNVVGEMSALIIHDFSGPLNAINLVAKRAFETSSPEKMAEYKKVMTENIDRIIDLTESLRDRLKNKNNNITMSSVYSMYESTLRLLQLQFHDLGISSIQFEFDPRLNDVQVFINSVDLGQILDNLYRNAIETMLESQASGRIGIHFVSLENGKLRFRISDDGPGLTVAQFKRLISFHIDSRGPKYKSLGLKLVHKLIEISGGELIMEAEPYYGRGTSFVISLPTEPTSKDLRSEKEEYDV